MMRQVKVRALVIIMNRAVGTQRRTSRQIVVIVTKALK